MTRKKTAPADAETIAPKPDGVFVNGEQVWPPAEKKEPTPREEVSDGVPEA